MKHASLSILGVCTGIGMLLVTPGAWALGPFDVEVAARVGGATSPSTGQVSTAGNRPNDVVGSNPVVNPLGLGLGARGGVSYSRYPDGPHVVSLYGGLSFMYYLGESLPQGGVPYAGYSTAQSLIYGVELGLNVSLSSLTIRPQLGIGDYTLLQGGIAPQDAPHAGPAASNWFYLEPGVTGLLTFGQWVVGADVGVLVLPDAWGLAGEVGAAGNARYSLTAHGQVGIKL